MESAGVCDAILPGLIPSHKDGSGNKSTSCTLVMGTPATFQEN